MVALVVCATLAVASVAPASVACTIVSGTELKRQSGRLGKLDTTTVQLVSADGRQGVDLPMAEVVRIECAPSAEGGGPTADAAIRARPNRAARPRPAAEATRTAAAQGFLFLLRDGQRLRGTPRELEGDSLAVDARFVGRRDVPMKEIVAVVRTSLTTGGDVVLPATDGPAPAADELRLVNGDLVTGVISASDERTVTCQSADGQSVAVEWANVASVRLAVADATAQPALDSAAAYVVEARDGSRVACASVTFDGTGPLTLAGPNLEAKLPVDALASIAHRSERVRLLDAIAPAASDYQPFFPRLGAPARADARSVTIAGQTTRSFVLARPHSRLTWRLTDDPLRGFARLRTRYGIRDGRRSANATVRIRLDDRVVHERANLTSGQLAEAVDLPLGDAKTLTLEVDFGQGLDVQDEVYWFEPALTR